MNILVVSRISPIPTNDGERLRVFHLIKQLAQRHHVTLICRMLNEGDHAVYIEMATYCKKIIGIEIREKPTLPQRVKRALPYLFTSQPISIAAMTFRRIGREIQKELNNDHYDLIQIHHSLLSEYIKWIPDGVEPVKVVNLHNLEVIRFPRLYEGAVNWQKKLFFGFEKARIEHFEGQALRKFDHVLSVSPVEVNEINKRWPDVNVSLIPNGVDLENIKFRNEQPADDKVIFVSSFAAQQNIEAALFLVREIWPLIHAQNNKAKLFLVGKDPSPIILGYNGEMRITVTGTVPSTAPYFRSASLCLVPIKSGGGTRHKILEAMAYGVPVVTTTLGVEGIPARPGLEIEIADNPVEIAQKGLDLLENKERCREIADAGRRFVERGFSWDAIGERLNNLYDELVKKKQEKDVKG